MDFTPFHTEFARATAWAHARSPGDEEHPGAWQVVQKLLHDGGVTEPEAGSSAAAEFDFLVHHWRFPPFIPGAKAAAAKDV